MLLYRRNDTELFPIHSMRPELVIPVVEPISTGVADCDSDHRLRHRHMDLDPLHIPPPVKEPLVGSPHIHHGPWCASLGTDPLEYLQHGLFSAMDSRTNRQWTGRTGTMVVARSIRCSTRRR